MESATICTEMNKCDIVESGIQGVTDKVSIATGTNSHIFNWSLHWVHCLCSMKCMKCNDLSKLHPFQRVFALPLVPAGVSFCLSL